MRALTSRQQEVLDFLRTYLHDNKFAPSVQNVADHFHISIKGAYDHLQALTKKGVITRRGKTARSIRLIGKER